MKLELPFAAVLLAVGCLLWSSQYFAGNSPRKTTQTALSQSPSEPIVASEFGDNRFSYHFLKQSRTGNPVDGRVVKAGFQEANNQTNSVRHAMANDPDGLTEQDSIRLLFESSRRLFNSVPISTEARLSMDVFGHRSVINGKYFQQGEGTNRSRMEFRIEGTGESDGGAVMTQICDGRFYYTLTQTRDRLKLEHVDLERVAQANRSGQPILNSPTDLMANGGVASALQNLVATFDFAEPVPIELGGVPMVSIRGSWKTEQLRKLVADWVEPSALNQEIAWEQLPSQLPHAVEVILGDDEYLPLFPYKIVFWQHDKDSGEFSKPMLTLELFEVAKPGKLPAEMFYVDTTKVTDTINMTQQMVDRVHYFQSLGVQDQQRTAKSTEESTR